MSRPTLVLAEDHELMSQGLQAMLEPYYTVLATVHDGDRVVDTVREHRPDVLLLDLSLPHRSGMDLLGDLARVARRPKIVVVTMHMDRGLADMALQLGAAGFVPKDAGVGELCTAIEEALAGRQYISSLVRPRTHHGPASDPMGFGQLTARQQEIVRLLAKGKNSEEIAERLGLSPHTIHYHRKSIRHRLGIKSDYEMVRYAMLVAMHEAERRG